MAKSKVGLRYLGLGYIVGIPARDLTPDEVEEYGGLKFLLSRQNGHGGKMFERPIPTIKIMERRAREIAKQKDGGE